MGLSFFSLLSLIAVGISAVSIPGPASLVSQPSARSIRRDTGNLTSGCQNGPTSRQCWGAYDINTNYYDTIFHTNRTREYWLNLEEIDCAPDGYKRKCLTANGTMPGPAIIADWGDDVVVHVTNNITTNGSAIHWHGIRQLNNNVNDGTPGITQCPIAPGTSMTYPLTRCSGVLRTDN
ncbi:MAG: laccase, multicopper oxidase, benzenediol:oxygen oxidorectuctase [Bogoriella megaspora]|nr:MAG: laccase, multicopper oxidase, benzenediol:oxygen oxidorectuctase [Bogoriella megaspora]